MRAPEKRREVVDKLIISLITLNRKGPSVSNDRAIAWAAGKREADHWRVIAGANVYESRAQPQSIAKLTYRSGTEDMRPGTANVLLLVVLKSLFAFNNVLRSSALSRVLPAREHRVGLSRIPVQPSGIIPIRKIKIRLSGEGARTLGGRVRNERGGKARQHGLNECSIRRRIVSRRLLEPIGWIALAGKEDIAGISLRASTLCLIETDETE